MKVYLERVGDVKPWNDQFILFQELATKDDVKKHGLTNDLASADLILSICHADVRFAKLPYLDRRFVFCTYDTGFPNLPGLYPSLTTWNYNEKFARSAPYLPKPWIEADANGQCLTRSYLFSFVGSSVTSPIRKRLLALPCERSFLKDTSSDDAYKSDQSAEVYRRFQENYREALARSSFVLCPRGVGTSSIRLFETMRAARVPVVISDDWVPPNGLPWGDFSLRVDEKDIESIPARLEAIESQAKKMGELARYFWESNFSEERVFNWMIGQFTEMLQIEGGRFRSWKACKLVDWRNVSDVTVPMIKRAIIG